jgi:hypothetical protein
MGEVIYINSEYPVIEVARGGNGNLLLVQIYHNPDGTISRLPMVTEMHNAVALAHEILRIADHAFLNPIRPPMYDMIRKSMN